MIQLMLIWEVNNWGGTVTSNKKGFQPSTINGRPVKSINQFQNKKKGKVQSELKDAKSSNRIKRLSTKINLNIDDYLHWLWVRQPSVHHVGVRGCPQYGIP